LFFEDQVFVKKLGGRRFREIFGLGIVMNTAKSNSNLKKSLKGTVQQKLRGLLFKLNH
jgi:hypothetical protein